MATDRELIDRLLTVAGIIMEDANPVALIDDERLSIEDRVRLVAIAGKSITTLADAARIVLSRSD